MAWMSCHGVLVSIIREIIDANVGFKNGVLTGMSLTCHYIQTPASRQPSFSVQHGEDLSIHYLSPAI